MKQLTFILMLLISGVSSNGQINVRVKNTNNTKEVDVKIANQSSSNKSKETPGNSSSNTTKDKSSVGINSNYDGYSGPALVHVKTFWEIVKKLEEGKGGSAIGLESQIKLIKQKDPAYNTASMESEWKKWKDKADETKQEDEQAKQDRADNVKASNAAFVSKVKEEKLLGEVIDGTQMQVGSNNLPYVDEAMAKYKEKVEQVLSFDLSKYKSKLADLKRYVDKSHTLAADRILNDANKIIGEVRDAENFTPIYKELEFRQIYWDAMKKIYVGDAVCEKYDKAISNMLSKLGSPEDIKKTAAKNNAEAIKNRIPPPALQKDATLEKALIDGFNAKYKETFKGTAIKVIILQPEWYIERNKLTGVVTGRNKHCALIYKGSDGKCYLMSQLVYAYQDYVGGSFGKTQIVYNGLGGEEMLCENAK